MKNSVMPALVTEPEKLDGADPLAPAFPLNAARMLSKLTRKPSGMTTAAVLRPCEIRAFVELVKLKQGSTDKVLTIGMDCLGAFGNTDYARFSETAAKGASTLQFYKKALGAEDGSWNGVDVSPACKACEYPSPDGADITIGLFGNDIWDSISLISNTERGEEALQKLQLPEDSDSLEQRQQTLAKIIGERIGYRDQMFESTWGSYRTSKS